MRWLLQVPQIFEVDDNMTREDLIEYLIKQHIIKGAADVFTLVQLDENNGAEPAPTQASEPQ